MYIYKEKKKRGKKKINNKHFNQLKIVYANSMIDCIKNITGHYSFSNDFVAIDFLDENNIVIFDGEEIKYSLSNQQYMDFLKACKKSVKKDHSKDFTI